MSLQGIQGAKEQPQQTVDDSPRESRGVSGSGEVAMRSSYQVSGMFFLGNWYSKQVYFAKVLPRGLCPVNEDEALGLGVVLRAP